MKGALLVCDPDADYLKKLETAAAGNISRPLKLAQYGKDAMKILANRTDSFAAVVMSQAIQKPDAHSVVTFARHVRPSLPVFVFEDADHKDEIESLLKRGVKQAVAREVSYAKLIELVAPVLHDFDPQKALSNRGAAATDQLDAEIAGSDGDFFPIEARSFVSGAKAFFDLYVRIRDATYVKILSAGDAFEAGRIDGYLKKNVSHFFLRKEVQGQYLIFRDQLVKGAIKLEALDAGAKQGLLTAQGEETLNFLHSVGVTENNLELASSFVTNLESHIHQTGFSKHVECTAFFEDLASVSHGVGVSMITSLLLKEMNISSARPVQTFGIAALMHDIGLKKLFPDLIHEDEKEIPADKMADFHAHPKVGAEILSKLQGVDPGLLQAIEQHHERRDRNGFPNRLGIGGINRIAEIIGVADELVHLARTHPSDSIIPYREEAAATVLRRFSNQVSGAAKALLFPPNAPKRAKLA